MFSIHVRMVPVVYQQRSIGGTNNPLQRQIGVTNDYSTPPYVATHKALYTFSDKSEVYREWRRKPLRTRKCDWNDFEHYRKERAKDPSDSLRLSSFTYTRDPFTNGRVVLCLESAVWQDLLDATIRDNVIAVPYPLTTHSQDTGSSEDELVIPDEWDVDQMNASSLQRMLPLVKNELSLVNSLLELKDLLSIRESINRAAKTIETITMMATRRGRSISKLTSTSKETLMYILGGASDGWLQWKFNLVPLVSDLLGVYRAITSFKTRIDGLLKEEGRSVRRHCAFDLVLPEFDTSAISGLSTTGVVFRTVQVPGCPGLDYEGYVGNTYLTCELVDCRIDETAKYHAEVQYRFTFTDLQREYAHSLALLDALGVNLNPAIIWNAIPWSFVVDWVIGVSRWLNDNKVGNMDPRITIERFAYSIRRERLSTYVCKLSDSTRGVIGITDLPPYHEVSYQRQVVPVTEGLLTTSGLNLTEFSLGAALVLSRKPRHRSRGHSRGRGHKHNRFR